MTTPVPKGYVIYNGFWNKKITSTARSLISSAEKIGVNLEAIPNTDLVVSIKRDGSKATIKGEKAKKVLDSDFVLFFDKDIHLARALELNGVPVFNNSESIDVCDNKATTHFMLSGQGIPMPKTFVAPLSYRKMHFLGAEQFINLVDLEIKYPIVVKESYGSLGAQVYLAKNKDELWEISESISPRSFLCQEFIGDYEKTQKQGGKDIRLYVVEGRVVASMTRQSLTGDFRANVGNGGIGAPYIPTETEINLAIKCFEILGLDFGGIDILIDKDGKPIVCEVNSNAQMKEITKVTGVDVALIIIEYVMSKVFTS